MKQINITRDSNDNVTFTTVSIDPTETVFFTNLDTKAAHWPTLSSNQLGASPSPNSSECLVPQLSSTPPYSVAYGCKIPGHQNEKGTVNVVLALAAGTTKLADANKGQAIQEQKVVVGGTSPYTITDQLFQVIDSNNNVIQSGSGIGPGLQLNPKPDNKDNNGISVTGTPTLSGTYQFTFTVNDANGRNLQQVQYSMKVA